MYVFNEHSLNRKKNHVQAIISKINVQYKKIRYVENLKYENIEFLYCSEKKSYIICVSELNEMNFDDG